MKLTCPHCGKEFKSLKEGRIPTHDYPPPCRAVCRGSTQAPKAKEDTPLWKDDPLQEARDWAEMARMEMLLYGFGAVKHWAILTNQTSGEVKCFLCQKTAKFSVAASNGHCAVKCETPGCVNACE